MTNREKLTKTALYDLILQINQGLTEDECVIQVLLGVAKELRPCPLPYDCKCEECIQNWLNKEAK